MFCDFILEEKFIFFFFLYKATFIAIRICGLEWRQNAELANVHNKYEF